MERNRSRGDAPKGKRSAFIRGEAGMRKTEEELERNKRKAEERKNAVHQPFRFRTPVGETRQIIITDDAPDFFMYEHALQDDSGNWGRVFSGCVKEFANCPVCEATKKESYYALFLSCIDLTPFDTRGGETVDFSRKLLVVKASQQKKFLRFYQKEGTLRGALFEMTRDGEKDSSIGNDIEFVEFVPEEELADYTRSWKDKEGKKHTEDCSEPFIYEDIFDEPDEGKLRALVGGAPTPGSRAHTDRELGGRGPKGRPSRRPADEDWEDADAKDGDDDDDLPFEPDNKPARGKAAAKPAARTRGRAAEVEDDDADAEADDDKPSRPSRAAPARGGERTRVARDTEEKDDGRQSRTARRR